MNEKLSAYQKLKTPLTVEDIVIKIFYSPATNGQAQESIKRGVELINDLILSISCPGCKMFANHKTYLHARLKHLQENKEMPFTRRGPKIREIRKIIERVELFESQIKESTIKKHKKP